MPDTKLLGLVGGLSWVSTLDYYRLLNEGVNRELGGLHCARLLINSIDFQPFVTNNTEGRWDRTLELMRDASRPLADAGVDALMLCANTAHAVIEPLKAEFPLPFIDIVEATGAAIAARGLRRVALLATQFTMELPFYREGLARRGIEAVVPRAKADRDFIQATLRDELGRGLVREATRDGYLRIARGLVDSGCEGVVFGCTEIPLVLRPEDFAVPCFDTMRIHCDAAVRFLVGRE